VTSWSYQVHKSRIVSTFVSLTARTMKTTVSYQLCCMIGFKTRLVAMSMTTTTSVDGVRKRTKSHSGGAGNSAATPKAAHLTSINEMTAAVEATLSEIDVDTVMEQLLAAIGKDVIPLQQHSSFAHGELEDRVMVVEAGEVCITSMVAPTKYVTLTPSRWAHLVAIHKQVDIEAKELNCKTRPVAFRAHIGDGYYVSMKDG